MKPVLILIILIAFCQVGISQTNQGGPNILWDEPVFESNKIKRFDIKQVSIKGYSLPLTRSNDGTEEEIRIFDEGKLTKVIELAHQDTQLTHTFHYNKRGTLGWKETTDKKWNRTYKEGYRFNQSQYVYQVKAYEVLRNEERMLLDTRQYTYDNDSLLREVKVLENGRVVSIHKFNYDSKYRVKEEIFQDENERVLQRVSYKYDAEDRMSEVTLDKGVISVYRYEYNAKGQPFQIEWLENGKTKGLVVYQYKNTGMVAQMDRILNPDTSRENHFVRVYNYNP